MGRVTRRADYLRAAKGRKHVTPSCVVQARPRDDETAEARAGFTATRKIGGAVVRNRAKRRLKDAVRRLLPRLGRPGVDYVFIARADTASRAWGSLLDDVERALISLAPAAAAGQPEGSPASEHRGRR